MSGVPRATYGARMHTQTTAGAEPARRNPLRVFCQVCRHTEFVHCDSEDRRCLYSECECGDFTLLPAA